MIDRAAELAGASLSPIQVMAGAVALFAVDRAFQRVGDSFVPGGPLDESAHLLTALLLLAILPRRWRAPIALPALIASVAIDLDHVPQQLGHNLLTQGTPRPYTHSLLTIAVLLALAAIVRGHRRVLLGLALGVSLHLLRDLAEGSGSGVALLWPFSDHAFSYSHPAYLALMTCVVVADLWIAVLSRRARAAVP